MAKKNDKISEIKDFFKSTVKLNNLLGLLELSPFNLVGFDNISTQLLINNNINTIDDLSELSIENPPLIKEFSQNTIIKWIKIAQVLKKIILEEIKTEKKILIIGLDNAGKTSLLNFLKTRFSMWKESPPTKGIQREEIDFFGYPVVSWDLGGQEEYRNMYLNKPKSSFLGAHLIVYVVDIQDKKRYDLSIEYFDKIVQIFVDMKEPIQFLIALNKSDPEIINTSEFKENVELIKDKINNCIRKYKEFNYFFANTSIYRVETVINLFSSALKKISEISEIIEHILAEFAEKVTIKAASLISIEGLTFGSYFNDPKDEILLNNSAIILLMLESFYNSKGLIRENVIIHDLPNNNFTIMGHYLFDFYSYTKIKSSVYLWMLSDNFDKFDDELEDARKQLLPLVKIFI